MELIEEYRKPQFPNKDALIIIILLIGIFLVLIVHFSEPKPSTNLRVVCAYNASVSCKDSSMIVRNNNIQASHSWDMKPYVLPENNDMGLYCFGIDDIGELWGNSMSPTFFESNTALLRNYTSGMTLHTGDIVKFYRGSCPINDTEAGMAVIHRITAIYDDRIVVQGDNLYEMETIQRCQITHVVLGILYT
jgi:hypothetical protein